MLPELDSSMLFITTNRGFTDPILTKKDIEKGLTYGAVACRCHC
jgi:hypothetical protein